MLCSFDRNYNSLHHLALPLSPPQTLSQLWFSCSPPLFCWCFFFFIWICHPSVHSFPPSLVLVFVSVPSSEIHPSFWAPCSLHPLHRNDCNSGCGLVLVVGAGVPEGKVWAELISVSVCLSVHPNSIKASCEWKSYPKDDLLASITKQTATFFDIFFNEIHDSVVFSKFENFMFLLVFFGRKVCFMLSGWNPSWQ